MSHDQLHGLLAELGEDVSQAQVAQAALARAERIRRRRAVIGAGVAVLVVAAGTVLAWSRFSAAPASNTGSPIQSTVDHLPAVIPTDPDAAGYWPAPLDPPADAPPVTSRPLSHAVLLFLPAGAANGSQIRYAYAYGEGSRDGGSGNGVFGWVRVQVDLAVTYGADGRTMIPVGAGSLSPDGKRAAFAQPDAVVLVSLTNGERTRIPVPGPNEDLSWLVDNERMFVSSASVTWLLDLTTTSRVRVPVAGGKLTPLVGGGSGQTTLTLPPGQPPLITVYDDAGTKQLDRLSVDLAGATVTALDGHGRRYGNLIAQAVTARVGSSSHVLVLVVNYGSGQVTRVLDLGPGRLDDCCLVTSIGPAGVNGSDAGLVGLYTRQEGLLSWRLSDGTVTRLTPPAAGILALSAGGCNWQLTIGDITSSCVT
jgi:hypothetical protein